MSCANANSIDGTAVPLKLTKCLECSRSLRSSRHGALDRRDLFFSAWEAAPHLKTICRYSSTMYITGRQADGVCQRCISSKGGIDEPEYGRRPYLNRRVRQNSNARTPVGRVSGLGKRYDSVRPTPARS